MDQSTYTDALGALLCSKNKRGVMKKKIKKSRTNYKHETLGECSPVFPEILHSMTLKTKNYSNRTTFGL